MGYGLLRDGGSHGFQDPELRVHVWAVGNGLPRYRGCHGGWCRGAHGVLEPRLLLLLSLLLLSRP